MNNVLRFKPRKVSYKALLADPRYLEALKTLSRAKREPGMSIKKAEDNLERVIAKIEREHEKLFALAEREKKLREAFK